MFKVKVDKELESIKKSNHNEEAMQALSKETLLLLEGAQAEDLAIIRDLDLDKNAMEIEKQQGINLERSKLDSDWKGKVFLESEIRQLCIEYNLRFLPIRLYVGKVDIELTAKIKELMKVNPTVTTRENQNFLIMAPKECFKLSGSSRENWTIKDKVKQAAINMLDPDPIAFYKISESVWRDGMIIKEATYRMIHKWGNDFSIMRLATSWRKRSILHSLIHWQAVFMFVLFSLRAYYGGSFGVVAIIGFFFLALTLNVLSHFIYNHNGNYDGEFVDELWDQSCKWRKA